MIQNLPLFFLPNRCPRTPITMACFLYYNKQQFKHALHQKSGNSLSHSHSQRNDTKLTPNLVFILLLLLLFSNIVSLVLFSLYSTLDSSIADFPKGKSKISFILNLNFTISILCILSYKFILIWCHHYPKFLAPPLSRWFVLYLETDIVIPLIVYYLLPPSLY